jgi:hypothetical protein
MLKETMLAPETNGVWKMARAAHDAPNPAVGFSEAKWAALLFESNCNVSVTSTIVTNTDSPSTGL